VRPSLQLAVLAVLALGACARGPLRPAELDTRNEQCGNCRMAVSDARFAAQLVAPGEEPRFFDDVGCLRDYLRQAASLPPGSVAFVADHRTKVWLPAAEAVYTRQDALQTPMGSHLIAHADAASREAAPEARRGGPLTASEVFGPKGPPRRQP
jgi:copper chaperone NosL